MIEGANGEAVPLAAVQTPPSLMADDSTIPSVPLSESKPAVTMVTQEIKAPVLPAGERVDKFLGSRANLSRSALQRLFEQERILVNGTLCKKNYKVRFRG